MSWSPSSLCRVGPSSDLERDQAGPQPSPARLDTRPTTNSCGSVDPVRRASDRSTSRLSTRGRCSAVRGSWDGADGRSSLVRSRPGPTGTTGGSTTTTPASPPLRRTAQRPQPPSLLSPLALLTLLVGSAAARPSQRRSTWPDLDRPLGQARKRDDGTDDGGGGAESGDDGTDDGGDGSGDGSGDEDPGSDDAAPPYTPLSTLELHDGGSLPDYYEMVDGQWTQSNNWALYGRSGDAIAAELAASAPPDDSTPTATGTSTPAAPTSTSVGPTPVAASTPSPSPTSSGLALPSGWAHSSSRGRFYPVPMIIGLSIGLAFLLVGILAFCVGRKRRHRRARRSKRTAEEASIEGDGGSNREMSERGGFRGKADGDVAEKSTGFKAKVSGKVRKRFTRRKVTAVGTTLDRRPTRRRAREGDAAEEDPLEESDRLARQESANSRTVLTASAEEPAGHRRAVGGRRAHRRRGSMEEDGEGGPGRMVSVGQRLRSLVPHSTAAAQSQPTTSFGLTRAVSSTGPPGADTRLTQSALSRSNSSHGTIPLADNVARLAPPALNRTHSMASSHGSTRRQPTIDEVQASGPTTPVVERPSSFDTSMVGDIGVPEPPAYSGRVVVQQTSRAGDGLASGAAASPRRPFSISDEKRRLIEADADAEAGLSRRDSSDSLAGFAPPPQWQPRAAGPSTGTSDIAGAVSTEGFVAHVATDDKAVLRRMAEMSSAPSAPSAGSSAGLESGPSAPPAGPSAPDMAVDDDGFEVSGTGQRSSPSTSSGTGHLPAPPAAIATSFRPAGPDRADVDGEVNAKAAEAMAESAAARERERAEELWELSLRPSAPSAPGPSSSVPSAPSAPSEGMTEDDIASATPAPGGVYLPQYQPSAPPSAPPFYEGDDAQEDGEHERRWSEGRQEHRDV